MELIEVERDGPVVRVRINRPQRHNALIPEMWQRLRTVGSQLLADGSVRCVVLSGNGASFSSGIDRTALAEGALTPFGFTGDPADRDRTEYEERDIESAQHTARWLAEADFVTIAAVRGFALGAGAQIAMAADMRIVASDAQFALPEIELGLFPEMSAVALLPQLVGYDRALELALTGRRVDAGEAHRMGLATSLVEPEALERTADDLAARIGRLRPEAVRYCKQSMRLGAAGDLDGSLRLARRGGLALLHHLITEWDR